MRRAVLAVVALLALPAGVQAQTETIEYYATDAIGSVRVVFGANGAVLARQDYGPFGSDLLPAPALPPEGFGGQETDAETDQGYFHARQYQSRTGRFTRVDPIYAGLFEPQRWNRYAYALNSPLSYVDPSGLMADPNEGSPNASLCTSAIRMMNPNDFHCRSAGGGGGGLWGLWGLWNPGQQPSVSTSVSSDCCPPLCLDDQGNIPGMKLGGVPSLPVAVLTAATVLVTATVRAVPDAPQKIAAGTRAAAHFVKRFPWERHHIIPTYFGGGNGPRVLLDSRYHQLITNEFRRHAGYGIESQSLDELNRILVEVYRVYPIPSTGWR